MRVSTLLGKISRRHFLQTSGAAALVSAPGVLGDSPFTLAQQVLEAPTLRSDLWTTGVDWAVLSWEMGGGAATGSDLAIEYGGHEVIRSNVQSGLKLEGLRSSARYTIRARATTATETSVWSAPAPFCTKLPRASTARVDALPTGGSASLLWSIVLPDSVANAGSVSVQLAKTRPGATPLLPFATQLPLSGNVLDSSHVPLDQYYLRLAAPDPCNLAALHFSEWSAAAAAVAQQLIQIEPLQMRAFDPLQNYFRGWGIR